VTETEEIAQALDDAARRWPGEPRGRLLARLIAEGRKAIARQVDDDVERHRAAIRESGGTLRGVYPPGYLEELRRDWPD